MASTLSALGDMQIIGVQDGAGYMYDGIYAGPGGDADTDLGAAPPHGGMGDEVDEHGRTVIPISAFVVRTAGVTAIIDAGIGERSVEWTPPGVGTQKLGRRVAGRARCRRCGRRGDRPRAPHPVHLDHNGWVWADDMPFFPNATVRCGAGDWALVEEQGSEGARMMQHLAAWAGWAHRGRHRRRARHQHAAHPRPHARPHDVRAAVGRPAGDDPRRRHLLPAPGRVARGSRRPPTSTRTGIATRNVLRGLEGTDTLVGGPHFPGLEFGRVLRGEAGGTFPDVVAPTGSVREGEHHVRPDRRTALVTGSGQHVGAGIARRLAEQGATVLVNDIVADRAQQTVGDRRRGWHGAPGRVPTSPTTRRS
ncbi:MAG: hypothetical protein U0W40_09980 [Acidimicrobiia bacterium]